MFGEAGHKILHRARSLRRLRPHEELSSHKRGVSVSSDASRASSSGSDTTSRRGNSVEWDPLHMHPSMEVDRSPHMTPLYHNTARHPAHHEDDSEHEQSPTLEQQAFHRPRHTRPGVDTQIYEGFDFGFGEAQATHTTGLSPHSRMMRAQKSEADLKRQKAAASSKDDEPRWDGLHSPSQLRPVPDGGFNEADYFIKRGGWKRRGIVFGVSAVAQGSEDDCFEI